MQAGDWMNYSVNITQAGYYSLDARVAWGGGATGNFHLEVDGLDVTGPIQIPDTNWGLTTVTRSAIQLPAGNHTMRVVADTNGAYSITGDIDYLRFTFDNSQFVVAGSPTTIPVHIDFDQLAGAPIPSGATINNQWLGAVGVKFYSNNPARPLHISQNCGPSCSTTSPPNFMTTKTDDTGVMNAEFTIPVSNLTFYMIGVDAFSFNQFAIVDVYRGGSLFASRPILGNGTYTVGFTFGTLDNITKIVVRNINDPLGIGFDDFFFNVPADVKITSGRVPGFLNGTTQKALLGADVSLNATAIPGLFTGGSYAWTFAGSPTPLTPMNQASATVRWTTPGTYRATVTYTKGTQTATANLDVEVVIPTLLGFVATEAGDRLTRDSGCNDRGFGVWYTLGCFERLFPGGPSDGSYRRIEPIQGSTGVLIQVWSMQNRAVRIVVVSKRSAAEAKESMTNFPELKDLLPLGMTR
jgi:hypothetical protein